MLTQDIVFEMVADVLREHGPAEVRGKSREEIMAEFRLNIQEDPDSQPMVNLLMAMFEKAYESGRKSNQVNADRYTWLRDQNWHDSKIYVVESAPNAVRLGTKCPSHELLDEMVDKLRQS